jgi:orotate phosphoribosyltransferase
VSFTCAAHFNYSLPRDAADTTIRLCVEELSKIEFDAIAFCGMSGALIAAPLAHLMHKELLMVRKNAGNDGSHSTKFVEGIQIAKLKIVIIDDLICTGSTMRNIVMGLNRFIPGKLYEIAGVILYDEARRTQQFTVREWAMVQPPTEQILKWKADL